jgi:magnesium-transporting ATPase (P-type)
MRVAELCFDSERKGMMAMHRDPAGESAPFTKGAIETVPDATRGSLGTGTEWNRSAELFGFENDINELFLGLAV